MKTLYPNRTVHAHSIQQSDARKKHILLFLFIALSALAFAGGPVKIEFKDEKLESGKLNADGAVYRFSKVYQDIDALMIIKGRSDALVYVVTVDMNSTGFDKAWQPQIGYNNGTTPGPKEWWMEFEIQFVKRGTNTPVTVTDFDISGIDIDGNGHLIREYVSFYGLEKYVLEKNSLLVPSDIKESVDGKMKVVGKRFDGPTLNFTNIDTSGTSVMVTNSYLNTNKFRVRVGGVSTGISSASERMYSIYFQDFNYVNPVNTTLPLKLDQFNATLASSKTVLNWVSSMEDKLSHYVVERSKDGKEFDDVTMIFANGSMTTSASYSYSDNIGSNASGLLYYRLKMVDENGEYRYSAVRIIKLNNRNQGVAISTYPNPVANELRITIPASWQNKQVAYQMYDLRGQMVKHFVSENQGQTQSVQMHDVAAGVYTIRLSAGDEMAVQRIVKTR